MTRHLDEGFKRRLFELLPGSAKREVAEASLHRFLHEQRISGHGLTEEVPASPTALWGSTQIRADLRRIHGFIFAAQWGPLAETADEATLVLLRGRLEVLFESWWEHYGSLDRESAPMAFHDETTAQRLMVLLGLRMRLWPDGAPSVMEHIMQQCRELLVRDDFYGGRNNHGMFQDLALLADAVLSPLEPATRRRNANVAEQRLRTFTSESFTDDGVLNEHSPGYHVLVVRSLLLGRSLLDQLVADGVLESAPDELAAVLVQAEEYATQVVCPDGAFPPISDTTKRKLDSPGNLLAFSSPEFHYAASCGAEGIAPRRRAAVYPDSGVAVFRERWGDRDSTYLHFASGYNGGYHKHSDEGSIYLETAGIALLREAGPYGYNYDHPLTKYAFSSFAHNGLVVDGTSLPRHDGKLDQTWMDDLGTTSESLAVRGSTTRFDGVRFDRSVYARSGDAGTVVDIEDSVRASGRHRYQFLWHLGPLVTPVIRGNHVELHSRERQLGELFFESSKPLRIRVVEPESDELLGWSFPDFGKSERAYTIEVEFFEADVEVRTTIRTGTFALRDRGIDLTKPDSVWTSAGTPAVTSMLVPPAEASHRLVVVFSAISAERDFTFNYLRSVQDVDAWRLFILDDWGDQGAYYYSQARDTAIFRSVQGVIARTAAELGIARNDIVTTGSSKGGAGAILHGLAAAVGRVIVAAPQTRIGLFTAAAHPNVLQYMAGGASAADAAWADHIIRDQLANSATTTVTIVVGDRDPHLKRHVEPFVRDSATAKARVDAVVIPGTPHNEIGAVFARALPRMLDAAVAPTPRTAMLFRVSDGCVALHLESQPGDRAVVKWFRGTELLATEAMSDRRTFVRDRLGRGSVRARVYVRDVQGVVLEPFTTPAVRL